MNLRPWRIWSPQQKTQTKIQVSSSNHSIKNNLKIQSKIVLLNDFYEDLQVKYDSLICPHNSTVLRQQLVLKPFRSCKVLCYFWITLIFLSLIISSSLNILTELRRQQEEKQDALNSETADLEGLISNPGRSKHIVIHHDHPGLCWTPDHLNGFNITPVVKFAST